jgi:hypothetical protein
MKLPGMRYTTCPPSRDSGVPPVGTAFRFAMVPWGVSVDERLKAVDVRIYAILAACRRKSTAKMGSRLLGRNACMNFRRVAASIERLISCGHIEISRSWKGARTEYRLLSPIFDIKGKVPIGAELKHVAVGRREMVACPRCHREVGGLLKAGWCRSCAWELKVRRIAQSEVLAGAGRKTGT